MRFWDTRAALCGVFVAASLGTNASCGTTFRQGGVRTEAESALLRAGSDDMAGYAVIHEIDGKRAEGIGVSNARYLLPPGLHVVVVRLVLDVDYEQPLRHMQTIRIVTWAISPPLAACFVGEAKGHYVVRPHLNPDRTFRPIVVRRTFNSVSGMGQPLGPVEHHARVEEGREPEVSVACPQPRLYPPAQDIAPPTAGAHPAEGSQSSERR